VYLLFSIFNLWWFNFVCQYWGDQILGACLSE